MDLCTYLEQYQVVRRCLTNEQILNLADIVNQSKLFEFDEYSHIYVRGTDMCVGYLGEDTAELVMGSGDARPFRKHLKKLFCSRSV